MKNLKNNATANWTIDSDEGFDGNEFAIAIECNMEFKVEGKVKFRTFDVLVHGPLICNPLGIDADGLEVVIILTVNYAKGIFSYTYPDNEILPTKSVDQADNHTINGVIIIIDTNGNLIGGRKTKGQISHPDHPIGK